MYLLKDDKKDYYISYISKHPSGLFFEWVNSNPSTTFHSLMKYGVCCEHCGSKMLYMKDTRFCNC